MDWFLCDIGLRHERVKQLAIYLNDRYTYSVHLKKPTFLHKPCMITCLLNEF